MLSTIIQQKGFLFFVVTLTLSRSFAFLRSKSVWKSSTGISSSLQALKVGDTFPSITLDFIVPNKAEGKYVFDDPKDISTVLSAHNLAVVFAVPGAFTPTCSAKHLPGFIEQAAALEAKGVDGIYSLSVNDKYVMRAWADSSKGSLEAGVKFIADGNAELATALGLNKDASGSRMGIRSTRFAAVLQKGVVTALYIDEKGLEKSSAENVLKNLP